MHRTRPPLELPRITDILVISRFMRKIEPGPDEEWLWTGAVDGSGYGSFRYKGHSIGAHRMSYAIFIGEIEYPLEVHHIQVNGSQPNSLNVNPLHLELVTRSENISERNTRVLTNVHLPPF